MEINLGIEREEEDRKVLLGAYVVLRAELPVQRIYMHPFTLANLMKNSTNEEFSGWTKVTEPYPLTDEEEKSLANYERASGLKLR